MTRIQDYERSLAQKIEKMAMVEKQASIISSHLEETMAHSDDYIRILSSNERSTALDPVHGTKSSDPVYRKISRAAEYAHNARGSNPYWGIAGIIQDEVTQIQVRMEKRQMTGEEYNHLSRTSMKALLAEWSEQIELRMKKSA
jgi:hypothetical protein